MNETKTLTTRATSQVDIRSLKVTIFEFPNSALRDLILSDHDVLPVHESILKAEIWLKLLKIQPEGKYYGQK
jgi:hypothetical protein